LAERYDHLTGEVRKNIPSNLKKHYGLDDDSPPGSQHSTKMVKKKREQLGLISSLGQETVMVLRKVMAVVMTGLQSAVQMKNLKNHQSLTLTFRC
jgi:hypothetical protein